jgi:hypothetical protein
MLPPASWTAGAVFWFSASWAALPTATGEGSLLAIRVGKAETISAGTIENAVILIEGGKIVAVGEDLPVERGIPVLDRPKWIAMPGTVVAYSRLGLEGQAGQEFTPEVSASLEYLPRNRLYREALECGVTTLALYPPGSAVAGRAVAVRPTPHPENEIDKAGTILAESVYLKVAFEADAKIKKMIRDAFDKVDKYEEKVAKAREKYEKDLERAKKAQTQKKPPPKNDKKEAEKESGEQQKDEEKKEEEKKDDKKESPEPEPKEKTEEKAPSGTELPVFMPPEPTPQERVFIDLRAGKLRALFNIDRAGDYLHLLQTVEKEKELVFDLRVPMTTQLDLFHVAEKLGEAKRRVVMEPQLTLHPGTMRIRNLPAELAKAGARIVFIPARDMISEYEEWFHDVGILVTAGLDRGTALRAMTLEPAELLGLGERLGSLAEGKDANLLLFDGDPMEATSSLKAVMLEGEFVYGEVK